MAFSRKNKAVVETNHVSAVRTGNIIAQYPAEVDMENGMAVAVNHNAKQVQLPEADTTIVYLHASDEQLYDTSLGRNAFYIKAGKYPKALRLEAGDIFETNALAAGATYAKGNKLSPGTDGFWAVGGAVTAVEAEIVDMVVLPNGEQGAKLVILKAE